MTLNNKFDVSCVYLGFIHTYFDSQGVKQGYFLYLVDSANEDEACPPGWIDIIYSENKKVLEDQSYGFPAYTTNTPEYGYLVSSASYVKSTDYGYVCVDISMTAVRAKQANSIIRLFLYLASTIVLLSIIGLTIVYFVFTKPLKQITEVANSFDNNDPKSSHQHFVNLKVRTFDELSDLSNSIKEMENGVVERFEEIIKVNRALLDSEKQTEKMTALAKRDSLTGVGSKTAYDIEVENINEQIKNKEDLIFGLVMIDLNYLKKTNDKFGHVAGDEALVKLANVICLTFKHSPVYRIGGDEFVVILRNEDYDNSSNLVEEFKERIQDYIHSKKLPQYERISAAIGFAAFDKEKDNNVDSVFKKADSRMYQCKREMKKE